MDNQRIGRLLRILGACERTALRPGLRVLQTVLIGNLRQTQALHTYSQPGLIHHGKHVPHAPMLLSHQVTHGSIKLSSQVEEPLMPIFFSRDPQMTAFLSPREPSSLTLYLGTRNRLMPLIPGGASGRRARTRWMMFSVKSWSPAVMNILFPLIR